MDWLEPLDHYCERTDASLWAEPLNAITNLSFIIAGILMLRLYRNWRQQQERSIAMELLVSLVFAVGIGSTLFHTFATRWALLADIIPILIFMYAYQAVFLRQVFGLAGWPIALYLVAFFILSQSMGWVFGEEALNGSIFYLPVLVALLGFSIRMQHNQTAGARDIGLAAGWFVVSLTFRTLDREICELFPLGTHFLWHLVNGVVLYLLLRGLLPSMRRHSETAVAR